MRIAFISLMTVVPWGGSEDLWYKAAKLALSQGHQVCTVTQRWSTVPERIAELQHLGADTKFYFEKNNSFAGKAARKLRLISRAMLEVPKVEADIYILSNGSTWDFIRFRQITDQYIHLHKPYILISQHNFESGDIVREVDRSYAFNTITRASKFLFVSQRNLESAQRQLAGVIENAATISNPLNTAARLIKPYPQSKSLLMACVARLDCAVKGQDILLQALSSENWVERDYKLELYGEGPHRGYLESLIKLYNLQEKVSLKGQVSDVDSIWDNNQLLILPSFNEGTPLSLLEAMMAGRTALVTDVGDNSRYILPDDTGILAAAASVNCLAESLERLWQLKDELEQMGKRAYYHAKEITDFTPENTLLNHILSNRIIIQ